MLSFVQASTVDGDDALRVLYTVAGVISLLVTWVAWRVSVTGSPGIAIFACISFIVRTLLVIALEIDRIQNELISSAEVLSVLLQFVTSVALTCFLYFGYRRLMFLHANNQAVDGPLVDYQPDSLTAYQPVSYTAQIPHTTQKPHVPPSYSQPSGYF